MDCFGSYIRDQGKKNDPREALATVRAWVYATVKPKREDSHMPYVVNYRLPEMHPVTSFDAPQDWQLKPGAEIAFHMPDGRIGTMRVVEAPADICRMRWSCERCTLDGEFFELERRGVTNLFWIKPSPTRITENVIVRHVPRPVPVQLFLSPFAALPEPALPSFKAE